MSTLKEVARTIEERWSNLDETSDVVRACISIEPNFEDISDKLDKLDAVLEDDDDIECIESIKRTLRKIFMRSQGLDECIIEMNRMLTRDDAEFFEEIVAMFRQFDKYNFEKMCKKHWNEEDRKEAARILANCTSSNSAKRPRTE